MNNGVSGSGRMLLLLAEPGVQEQTSCLAASLASGDVDDRKTRVFPRQHQRHSAAGRAGRTRTADRAGAWLAGELVLLAPSDRRRLRQRAIGWPPSMCAAMAAATSLHAIEAYAIKEMCADIAGLVEGLGEKQAILIGHDWGAPIVWNTSLFFPDKVRAVAGLSVPHTGRGPAPRIELFRNIYKDRFFYQLYFQEPGVAEAEFEADLRTALRKIYYSGFRRRQEGGPEADQAGRREISRRPCRSRSVPGLAHGSRPRLLCRAIRAERLSRTAQPLPHGRARLCPAGGDRGPQDRAAGRLHRGPASIRFSPSSPASTLSKSCASTSPIFGSSGSSMAPATGFSRNVLTRSMRRCWNGCEG